MCCSAALAAAGCAATSTKTVTVVASKPATRATKGSATARTVAGPTAATPRLVCVEAKGYLVPQVKPVSCELAPENVPGYQDLNLADLHWTSWGPTSATATGENIGRHHGANGSPPIPVRLVASGVGKDPTTGGIMFTQVTQYSADAPNGYTLHLVGPEKPRPSETNTTCANGVQVTAGTCTFADQVSAAFIKEEGNHYSSIELSVDGRDVTCREDSSADGHFGDITCTDNAGASVEFAVYATTSGGSVAGRPINRAPESATQQELCDHMYREYQEGSEAAIQEYGRDGCQ